MNILSWAQVLTFPISLPGSFEIESSDLLFFNTKDSRRSYFHLLRLVSNFPRDISRTLIYPIVILIQKLVHLPLQCNLQQFCTIHIVDSFFSDVFKKNGKCYSLGLSSLIQLTEQGLVCMRAQCDKQYSQTLYCKSHHYL